MTAGRYYLGRVLKINLDQLKLVDAIINAPIVEIGKFEWTITDIEDRRNNSTPYVFGRLAKYAKEGHVQVVDEPNRSQIESETPNLVIASSPFVYLPDYSGIAFLKVWNGIQEDVFPRRFKSIIEAAYDDFFVGCDIEAITDYQAFTSKLRKLDKIIEINSTVHPPNPLFGRLWGELNDYIDIRNATEVTIKEQTSKSDGLKSKVVKLMTKILENSKYEPDFVPDIGDAAILMAADGYGRGTVRGTEQGEEVIIRTSDTKKSFMHSAQPVPEELAEITKSKFESISKERDMKH